MTCLRCERCLCADVDIREQEERKGLILILRFASTLNQTQAITSEYHTCTFFESSHKTKLCER